MLNLTLLLQGMLAMGFAVAGLFFLKFWHASNDRLFGAFALAFFIFAAERIALGIVGSDTAIAGNLYLVRLAGFVLILAAIIDKNRNAEGAGK